MSIFPGDIELHDGCAADIGSSPRVAQITAPETPEAPESPEVESRVRMILMIGLLVLGLGSLLVRCLYPFDFLSNQTHGWFLNHLLGRLQNYVGSWSLPMTLSYPAALLAIFMLERRFPAAPAQKTFSAGLLQDGVWLVVYSMYSLFLFSAYSKLLTWIYTTYLGFLSLPLPASIPMAARVAMGVLAEDLGQWVQHWLHHNVKWLWPFHSVHHSQRELNVLSDFRNHFMDYAVRRPATLLPLLMLGVQSPQITWWLLLTTWQTRLNHSNVRFNFGPLRYLFVTPQSHRVHHSTKAEHHDRNYGSIFSFWDYLFGTQVRVYDIYPATGIEDENFPHGSTQSLAGMLLVPIRQIVYPFQRVGQIWAGKAE